MKGNQMAETPNPKVDGARARLSAALTKMMAAANASATNPAFDAEYATACAAVAAAEDELKGAAL